MVYGPEKDQIKLSENYGNYSIVLFTIIQKLDERIEVEFRLGLGIKKKKKKKKKKLSKNY